MNLKEGIEKAISLLGEHKIYGKECVSECPFCDSDKHKFYLNIETGLYSCKRASCGAHGHINALLEKLNVPDRVKDIVELKRDDKPKVINVENKVRQLEEDDEIVAYMIGRGISYDTLIEAGCMKRGQALSFITKKGDDIVGVSYRTADKQIWQESGSQQYLWNRTNLDKNNARIYITEGRVDALTLIEMGYTNVVSMPNGASGHEWIDKEWKLLNEFKEIVLLYDNDKAGKQGFEEAKRRMDFASIFTINLGKYKDINEAYMEDSNFLYEAMEQAKEIQLDGFVSLDGVTTSEGVGTELYSCGIPQFDTIFGGVRMGESTLIVSSSGAGKAQPLTSKLYTSNGEITMGDIKIGDMVYGEDGLTHKVIGVFPQGKKRKVIVTFSDGSIAECCDEHLWNIITHSGATHTKTLKEIIESGYLNKQFFKNQNKYINTSKYRIPVTLPVKFVKQEHIISPYLLGVLIGDGYICNNIVAFSTNEDYIVEAVEKELHNLNDYVVKKYKGNNYTYVIKRKEFGANIIKRELNRMNISVKSYDKFIPDEYKYDSVENRLALLRGIYDTDGCTQKSRTTIHTTSYRLKDDIVWLCQSLGMTATVSEDRREKYTNNGVCYRISIQFNEGYEPFTSPKHISRYAKPKRKTDVRRYIKDIEYTDEYVEMQCIQIDSSSQLYLTDNFIVTHNTTVLCNMIKGIISQNEKCGVFSGELTNANLKAWIYSVVGGNQAVNLTPHPFRKGEYLTSINPEKEKEIDKKIKGKLWIYDGGKSDAYLMLKNFSALNKRFGVKYFFIDNLSILNMQTSKLDQWGSEDHFAKVLAEFCRTHKCHVFLFAHPTKSNMNTDAEFIDKNGRVKPISRYDQYSVRGSATLVNLSHNIMFLMRVKNWERQYFIQQMRDVYESAKKTTEFQNDVLPLLKNDLSLFAYLAKNRGCGKTFEDAFFGYDNNTRRIYGLLTKNEDLSREVDVEEEEMLDDEELSISFEEV